MSSRRGPEMAAGEIMLMVRRLLEAISTSLLFELSALGLEQIDIAAIMRDFSAARRHIYFTMMVKNSYWGSPPWLFMGLGHRNVDIARAVARRCLLLKEKLDLLAPIHYVTFQILFVPLLLSQLQDFAAGADLTTLPELFVYACIFRFAFTSDTRHVKYRM